MEAGHKTNRTEQETENFKMGVVASASGSGEGKKFEKATEMIQQGVLADIIDRGLQPNQYKPGTFQHKVSFVWVLEEKDSEGRNKRVFEKFTNSLDKKANMRKRVIEFGAKFSPNPADPKKELIDGKEGVELDSYIGTKRTLVLSAEDSREPGGEPFIKVLATQKPQGKGVDIPADFVRQQDKAAR